MTGPARVWADGPAGGTPINAARLNGMEADIASAKDRVFNVKDYGAKGDNSTDDTAAVQATVNAIALAGGGVLFFPAATYYIPNYVTLCSNIEITGKGATLTKKSTTDAHYAFFFGSSGTTKGYGAGANGITCHGITFQGNFDPANKISACAFALHHSDYVLVYDCKFTQMAGSGHRFDLQGCRFVVILDSTFEGFDTSYGQLYTEDIQLDFSARVGDSVREPSTLCYDGLPTIHVVVDHCRWVPLTIGATTYPAGNPMGEHGSMETQQHAHVRFLNNYIGNPVQDNTSTFNGILHFIAAVDVLVAGNIFENNAKLVAAVRVYPALTGIAMVDAAVTSPTAITYTTPMVADSIRVINNTFTGFSNVSTAQNVVSIAGQTSGVKTTNITVDGNTFTNNKFNNDNTVNDSANLVTVTDAQNVSVSGNKATMCRRLTYNIRCTTLTMSNNIVNKPCGQSIAADTCIGVVMSGNQVLGSGGVSDLHAVASSRVAIQGNASASANTTGPAITVSSTTKSIVSGNILTPSVTTATGISVVSTSTQNIVANNLVLGFTTPITVDGSSTATQSGNVTA